MTITFTIPTNPATKKTAQRVVRNKRTGKPLVIPSKRTKDWTAMAQTFMRRAMRGQPPLEGPVTVAYLFLRTDDRADLGGMEAAMDDAMQGIVIQNDKQITVRTSSKARDTAGCAVVQVSQPSEAGEGEELGR